MRASAASVEYLIEPHRATGASDFQGWVVLTSRSIALQIPRWPFPPNSPSAFPSFLCVLLCANRSGHAADPLWLAEIILLMKPSFSRSLAIISLLLTAAALPGHAEVRLPKIFASHMVLQQQKPLAIWGWAAPGEQVTVELCGQKAAATAASDGKWRATLAPLQAGGPFKIAVRGRNRIELDDVLVGEVWICCGQSNMEMPVGNSYRPKPYPGVLNFQQELATAKDPQLRLFLPDHQTSLTPKDDLPGPGWQVCTPETADRFSAVGYFFGRHLRQTCQVPVGMIEAAKSSTTAQAWTSLEGLRTIPEMAKVLEKREKQPPAPMKPTPNPEDAAITPRTVEVSFEEPGCLYNGMIAPLVPLTLRGAIFYQGESNASGAREYRTLFSTLIRSWRKAFAQGDFPFLFVQLAAFGNNPKTANDGPGWAALREAQTMTLAEPNTGMAVTIDIGSARLIHPPNKQEVGRRLGILAEAIAYGRNVPCEGPRYRSSRIEGGNIRVQFDHAEGGLVAKPFQQGKPPVTVDRLAGFAVAGADKVYQWADARIVGNEVIVSSPQVPNPVSVRYAWHGNPNANLYNQAGLPTVPFRTDKD